MDSFPRRFGAGQIHTNEVNGPHSISYCQMASLLSRISGMQKLLTLGQKETPAQPQHPA